jgi:predicted RNA methylase
MKTPPDLSRLHNLRMDNDAHRYAMEDQAGRFAALKTRQAPRAVSAYQLFQTPDDIARRMVELAHPAPRLTWLEPSAGLGRLLRPIFSTDPQSVTACEVDTTLAGELFQAFDTVELAQRDFLTVRPPYEGGGALIVQGLPGPPFFDRVVMNPPFHMRSDIKHILHALEFLKRGGVLVGLCMATHHRAKALEPLADHWELLPADTFAKEGTRVETYLFRITKGN